MKRVLLFVALLLLIPTKAFATWSIIAIDLKTGRIVIASATCAATGPDQLKRLQAIVLPGIGVAAAQAGVDRTHANQRLIFAELRKGTHPREIIRLLEADTLIERRQFGIIDMQGRRAGLSGAGNGRFSLDIQGNSADSVVYSVQGNIITTTAALTEAARIMGDSKEPLIDRVMLAMEKADELGGDSRCNCQREPLPAGGVRCTNKTAHVAYILAADPDNPLGTVTNAEDLRAPYNDGNYYLYLSVIPTTTQPNEDANPVRTLRMRYDAWKASRGADSP